MKKLLLFLFGILWILLTGCGSTVNTTVSKSVTPNTSPNPIIVYAPNEDMPSDYENIGTIRIGDSGFTVNCGFQEVVEKAMAQCRKMGGEAIKVIKIKEPDGLSTCYRITAIAYKGPKKEYINPEDAKSGYTEASLVSVWNNDGVDNIEGIYERLLSDEASKYKLAVKKVSNTEYLGIYLDGIRSDFEVYWDEGDVKAKIFKTATPNFFKVNWYMADKSKSDDYYISFDKGMMTMISSVDGKEDKYLKLFPTTESVLESVSPSIVSSGTGFALNNEGYILTNHHVVDEAKSIIVRGINRDFNKTYDADIIVADKNNDLAIIKIADSKFALNDEVPYSFKNTLSDVGESVFAMGYPLRATMGDEIKLTNGIISSKTGFQGDVSSYQISVPVHSGNSGGPLVDYNGNIIGVITAKHTGAENASYAVKISYLMNLLELSDSPITINNENVLNGLSFTEQVKKVNDFVYIIECK